MSSRRPALLGLALLLLLSAWIWVLATREPPKAPRAEGLAAGLGSASPRSEPPPVAAPSAPTAAPAAMVSALPPAGLGSAHTPPIDERALMDQLRALRSSNPELSLRLAREGNQRFPGDADAAERAWFVVKALSDLGRHDEAKREGRELLREHRGSKWAEDVYRHLFVNPGTDPAERGYGKQLELE